VLELIESLGSFKDNIQLNAILIGDCDIKPQIYKYLAERDIHAKFVTWVNHKELSQYLNDLKILVVPSYREGLPNIVLEAMACGTLVVATAVGGIPDVIKDEVTGFIMENNSPECISRNIFRAINHPDFQQIANNGRSLIEKEFTFEKSVERFGEILNNL